MFATYARLLCFALTVTSTNGAAVQKRLLNGVGLTPAMGWNNYNANVQPSAANALATANAFISLGLKALGYEYINMDDGWPSQTRDASGNFVANPALFPNGIANLTSTLHSMGLKFGLYGDSGTATCSGFPGSQGFEKQDAAQLSAWGVDYWKYDNCNTPSGNSEPRYQLMQTALAAQSHKILYSLCQWGLDQVWTWGATVGNSWRASSDITNNWNSIANIAASNVPIAGYARPGGFNDFDMMEIGNGVLTAQEERAHFGLWAIAKSPLLLGTDLTKISASSLATISNAGVISINQDSLGIAATIFQPTGQPAPQSGVLYPYWSGPLSDGYVVALVATNAATTLSVSFADVPGLGAGTFPWTELYTGATGTGTSVSAKLALHDMAVFKVVTGKPGTAPSTITTSVPPATSTSVATPTHSTSTVTVTPTTTPGSGSGGTVGEWGQCGGLGWMGGTVCVSPFTCTVSNPYYSQCI